MIHAEQKATTEYVTLRAQWEARSRAAKAKSANVTVVGWRQSDGNLWQTNRLVSVTSPSLGLYEDFLIGEVTYELTSSGMVAMLKLVRPDAYTSADELHAAKDIIKTNRVAGKGGRAKSRGVSQAEIQQELNTLNTDF